MAWSMKFEVWAVVTGSLDLGCSTVSHVRLAMEIQMKALVETSFAMLVAVWSPEKGELGNDVWTENLNGL
jgi:hypothetical protein